MPDEELPDDTQEWAIEDDQQDAEDIVSGAGTEQEETDD